MTNATARPRRAYIALFMLAVMWGLLLTSMYLNGRAGVVDRLEYQLLDLRHQWVGPVEAAPQLMIVAIDDETLASDAYNASSLRQMLASLIENIAASGARGLALDVLLVDQGDDADDARLATALATLPSTIAGAATFSGDANDQVNLIWPNARFEAAAQVGLVNMATDGNGLPRFAPLMVDVGGQWLPSMPLLAATTFAEQNAEITPEGLRVGERFIPLDDGFYLPLRVKGPEATVPTLSAMALMDGAAPKALSGKMVVLGFSASAMGDRFATPFGGTVPGMEVIATSISQLLGAPGLRRDQATRTWDALHAATLMLAGLLVILVWPMSRGVAAAAALVLLSVALTGIAFASGLWLNAALPLLCALPPMVLAGGLRYANERREAAHTRKTADALRRFQSPVLAERIERDPHYLAKPQEQRLVILFADLTGFTTLSQKLGPGGTHDLLHLFHESTAAAVEAEGGSVFNYMGDGVMAVFGLEAQNDRPADQALRATFNLVLTLSAHHFHPLPGTVLHCRVGLHIGDVTLSRLGADRYQQVTVTGDTVNVASRLMEVAKSETATVAASEAFCASLSDAALFGEARETELTIRGRDGKEVVHIWTDAAVQAAQSRQAALNNT